MVGLDEGYWPQSVAFYDERRDARASGTNLHPLGLGVDDGIHGVGGVRH
jgi:hypothetical protein